MAGIAAVTQKKFIKIDPKNPELSILKSAFEVLNNGGLVVAPTETLYGILAKVELPLTVEHLFEVKGRCATVPSAVFVQSVSDIEKMAFVSAKEKALCNRFLPGPITIVLKARKDLGSFFTLNGRTGFRISSSPVISALVKQAGPFSATSANLSGLPEPSTIEEIHRQLGDGIDIYLDAGKLNNPPSTVVEVIDDQVRILREGAIGSEEIQRGALL